MFGSKWSFLRAISPKENICSRIIDDIMEHDSPSLDYYLRFLRRRLDAFTQFIDILIATKQNDIVDFLLNTS